MTIPEHRLSAWRAHRTAEACLLFAPGLDNVIGPEWTTVVVGGGTVSKVAAQPAARIAVTSASGDEAALASREKFRATPSGVRYGCTFYHSDAGQTNQVRKWMRYGDDDEGVFFMLDGTTLSIVRGSKAAGGGSVLETIGSASWNGTRPSGFDLTKLHRYEVEVGPSGARVFIDDVLVHTFTKEGVLAEAMSRFSALSLTAFVKNTGASTAGHMTLLEPVVAAHGEPPSGPSFSLAAEAALSVAGVTLLSIRPKATFGTLASAAIVHPTKLSARAGALGCSYRVVAGATLAGAAYADVDASSAVEKDTSGTPTGGVVVAELVLGPDQSGELDLRDVFGWRRRSLCVPLSASPTGDVLTVVGIAASGTPTGRMALHWNEVR